MIITVTPKIVILALFGGSRLCSVSGLWHPLDSQSGQSVVESEWGEVGECPLSASLLWSSGCRAAAPQRSTSSWAPLDRLSVWREKRILRDWPITALCRTHGISNRGPLPLDPAVILPSPPPPISQFFDTKITLAGRCNSHISGIFASVLCIFWKRSFDFFFFSSVLYCYFYLHAVVYKVLAAELALHCSYAETLWSEVPLYVHPVYWMQNEDQYYRPLMIVYLFLTDHAFFVWQYSVVLPGSILRCVRKKKRCLRRGMWVFAAPSCSTCLQAVPPCPLPSCYAMTSSPPPPQEDPVALPWPSTYRPSYLFLCKKTRGWGPLQHAKAVLGMSTPPRAWHILTIVPHALLSALQTGRSFCKVRLSHQNTVMYLKVRTLYQKVGLSLWAEDASVQLDLRVGELMIQSMRCSSPYLSFLLWEQSLKLRRPSARSRTYRPHASKLNPYCWGEEARIESSSQKDGLLLLFGETLLHVKRCQCIVPI